MPHQDPGVPLVGHALACQTKRIYTPATCKSCTQGTIRFMKKVRWGVLGVANIAVKKVIPAMQHGEYCEVTGIASRDLARAETAARELGVPKAYRSLQGRGAASGERGVVKT